MLDWVPVAGEDEDEATAGPEDTPALRDHARNVADVLEHVEGDDRIDLLVAQGQLSPVPTRKSASSPRSAANSRAASMYSSRTSTPIRWRMP